MRPQMNTNHLPCFVYNSSGCRVGYWKNPPIGPHSFGINGFPKPSGYLLWNKNDLRSFPLWGFLKVNFRSSISLEVNCRTSLILTPLRVTAGWNLGLILSYGNGLYLSAKASCLAFSEWMRRFCFTFGSVFGIDIRLCFPYIFKWSLVRWAARIPHTEERR